MQSKPIVDRLSYSAVRSFLTSPYKFYKFYVNREKSAYSLTMAVGSAWHHGLENYFKGDKEYIKKAVEYLYDKQDLVKEDTPSNKHEKLEKDFIKSVEELVRNLKTYQELKREWEPEMIERKINVLEPIKGGIGITGRLDVITKDPWPVDHKYVSRFSSSKEGYYVQAWFYYYLVKEAMGEYPKYFIVSEFKRSKNRDGSPQLRDIPIEYKSDWIQKIDQWYLDVCEQILNQRKFMPNPFQAYGANDWTEYLNET